MKNINNFVKNNHHQPNELIPINGVVVVEGKTDTAKLKKIFKVDTIETNGLNISNDTINLIKNVAKTQRIILLLDPDGPGEIIRKKITNILGECDQVFISKKDIDWTKTKLGVAEAYDNALIKAFKHLTSFNVKNESISWNDYLKLELNTIIKRKKVCDYFHISICNHKQLFKRLNMMNVTFEQVLEVING